MDGMQQLTDNQRAAMVARFVEMQDISTVAVNAQLLANHDVIMSTPRWKYEWEKKADYRFEESQKLLIATIHLVAHLGGSTDEKNIKFVSCTASYRITYSFNATGGPPAEERDAFFSAFVNLNGVFNAWPFFRELVHSMLGRMGLQPISLPVYRIVPPPKKEAEPKAAQLTEAEPAKALPAKKKKLQKAKTS